MSEDYKYDWTEKQRFNEVCSSTVVLLWTLVHLRVIRDYPGSWVVVEYVSNNIV